MTKLSFVLILKNIFRLYINDSVFTEAVIVTGIGSHERKIKKKNTYIVFAHRHRSEKTPGKIRRDFGSRGDSSTFSRRVCPIKISPARKVSRFFVRILISRVLSHTRIRDGREYLPDTHTRGVPRGEWQLQTVRTQARSSDPARTGNTERRGADSAGRSLRARTCSRPCSLDFPRV